MAIQRNNVLKNILFATILIFISGTVMADRHSYTGTVKNLRTHDSQFKENWFTINGFSTDVGCPRYNGLNLFMIRFDAHGKQMLAAALAAKMSGATITATLDNADKNAGGYCYLQYVTYD